MALKRKNDEFFVMPLKRVLSVMGLVNHTGTQKMWAIADKNGYTRKNDKFFCHSSLKNVLSVMGLINHLGIPKLWTLAHENGHRCKK
jgi:hypothetical protein